MHFSGRDAGLAAKPTRISDNNRLFEENNTGGVGRARLWGGGCGVREGLRESASVQGPGFQATETTSASRWEG